jgi:hypothetical protein
MSIKNSLSNQSVSTDSNLPAGSMRLVESMSRGCVPSLASVFKSANHAIKELVDNAVNYRADSLVEITIKLAPTYIRVQNVGGRGMSVEHIANFISWGSGEDHASHEISQYRVGGKAAINYLGEGFRLWCRMTKSSDHWILDDPDFSCRTYLKDYGNVAPADFQEVPASLKTVSLDQGYVRLEVVNPNPRLRLDADALMRDLGNTYKPLIEAGEIQIKVNGQIALPSSPVLDEDLPQVPIEVNLGDITVSGWVAKLARGPRQPRPGLALYSKGRKILDGEWFSQNAFAKGALSSFYGELVLSGITLNVDKSDYVERGEAIWSELGKQILNQAAPILNELRGQGSAVRITDRDRRLAKRVRDELEQLLEEDSGEGEETITIEEVVEKVVREPIQVRVPTKNEGGGSGRTITRRKISVKYESVKRDIAVGGFPEVIIDAWESSARSLMRVQDGRRQIVINKSHPAYSMANARFVIAECVLAEVLGNRLHETSEYRSEVDQLLATWASKEQDSEES